MRLWGIQCSGAIGTGIGIGIGIGIAIAIVVVAVIVIERDAFARVHVLKMPDATGVRAFVAGPSRAGFGGLK